MLTSDDIISLLEENKESLKAYGVKKIALFGSYARGDATQDSDVDLLVEFEKGRGLYRDHTNLLDFLEDKLQKPVDLVKPHLLREELKPRVQQEITHITET